MAPTRWLSADEQAAWRGLQGMIARLDLEMTRRLSAESDLSLQDYVVLVVLSEQEDDRVRVSDLADLVAWERSRLSHHAARMESRGLVKRQRCPSDKRGTFIAITDAGRIALRAAAPGHVEAVREIFISHLTPQQVAQLTEIVTAVTGGGGAA